MMYLLESVENLRPVRETETKVTKSYSIKKERNTASCQALPPPSIRLRLDEALENARRNRQSNVFPSRNSTISNIPWRKAKKGTTNEDDSDSSEISQMAQILRPNTVKANPIQRPSILLRGEESLENRIRGLGSLCLKEISKEESFIECQKDVHIRCPRGEALNSLQKGKKGVGVSILLNSKEDQTPIDEPHNPLRSVPSNEAYANWQRDRIKEASSMEQILNQGWSCKSGLMSKPAEIQTSHKSQPYFDDETDRIDHSGTQMAVIFGVKSASNSLPQSDTGMKIAPRSIPQSAAPNAAREGAGMAERFGLTQRGQEDTEETLETKSKATLSLDMWQYGTGPRAKHEGLEYANKNRGTLNNSNLHSLNPEPIPKQIARIRPEAAEICESSRGQCARFC
ncbi:unnamed protein product [Heterobilharzia americana]|nr:unnamed protein product [Heterobilharzia americana]